MHLNLKFSFKTNVKPKFEDKAQNITAPINRKMKHPKKSAFSLCMIEYIKQIRILFANLETNLLKTKYYFHTLLLLTRKFYSYVDTLILIEFINEKIS